MVKLYRRYPDSKAGYTVKFSDGDQQEYVHANLRLVAERAHIDGPVPRALSVGERVMILASADQCRRNTAAAGGWTWLAREAARCGQVFDVDRYLVSCFFVVLHFMLQTDCVCPYVHVYHFLP